MYNYDMHLSGRSIPRYKQIVYFEKKLLIETYIIGYKSQGESILFFIRTDGGISFSGLVDCFYLKDIDKVRDILEGNKISTLDFICWTHPDWDHSKGLENIIEKIPTNFFGEHIHIMKIPHHGSGSSVKMLDLGWDGCDVACSTVYRRGNDLPLKEIMEQYNKNAQILLCTGKVDREKEEEDYGVIKIVTDVIENKFSVDTEGNAEIWSNT